MGITLSFEQMVSDCDFIRMVRHPGHVEITDVNLAGKMKDEISIFFLSLINFAFVDHNVLRIIFPINADGPK